MPEPGAEWAGFHVEEQIGAGGYGQVFAAWDPDLERRVAIKALPADAGETAKERFLRESKIAGGLDHPRIIPILRAADADGVPYIVMRYVSGGDLRQHIHLSPLTLERATSVIGQVAGALDHAHRNGLVHRDVKPANVLCAEDSDDVYLTDFGITRDLARTGDAGLTATGETVASPHYAAPEQLRGDEVEPATDIYGLGCTLFEALTGRVPFPGETSQVVAGHHLHSDPPRVTDLRPDLPSELDGIVATALAKDPRHRFPDARSLAQALAVVEPDDAPGAAGTGDPGVGRGPAGAAGAGVVGAWAAGTAGAEPTQPVAPAPGDTTAPEGRSVFENPASAHPIDGPGGDTDALAVVPTDIGEPVWHPDGTVDGAALGVYEDETPRRRTPAIVGGLLVLAAVAVGVLVWRAANTDAELSLPPADTTSTTSGGAAPEPPTEAAARDLVPDGVSGCVVPPGPEEDDGGSDTTTASSVRLECPMDDVPELLTLELFASTVERDAVFDALVDELGVPERDDAECALGRLGRHPFAAEDHAGTVACQAAGGRVDFVSTRDDEPVLLRATGGGLFDDYERSWTELAGRTDARFPLPEEQRLLDALPDALLDGCRRDLGLALAAPGTVAIACEPAEAEPALVSWVQFADTSTMDQWLDERRSSLANTFDRTDDGCTPEGFGDVERPPDDEDGGPGRGNGNGRGNDDDDGEDEAPPVPDAAVMSYEVDGSSGRILCFLNTSGQNVLLWIRDGTRVGSIAVSDREEGQSMADLLRWWRDDGYLP